MSTDAIISICLAVSICVACICLCVSSCYNAKHYCEPKYDESNYASHDYNTTYWKTTTYNIPLGASAEERLSVLNSILEQMKDGSIVQFKIDGKEYSVKELEDFIKSVKED